MKKPELLSPAGDFECLKQAVWAKADAVYFGAKSFNARIKANNFGIDMKQAVAFCHMHGVKAYLTLNTLIENDQISDLIETVKNAISCGIDAFIVQDFGVLNILKNGFENIEIHASTQMAVNNYQGAIEAEKMGIKRVVLSRETNIEDIKLIKSKTNLEVEYFIQGALCVCLSGNCYLSSKLFSKSGNKGECLQPCRLKYKAILKGKEIGSGFLLSAKDICMANRLKQLATLGVDSFKIEGRLRRPAYVAGVTRVYRKIIDNNYAVDSEDITRLKKCFNRGDFTEGYLNGNSGIIDFNIQGHKGVKIGSVTSFKKGNRFNVVEIQSNHEISKGDGLKLIKNGIEISSMSAIDIKKLNKNTFSITTTAKALSGADVYLILDSKKEQQDLQSQSKLALDFKLVANSGEKISLEYRFKEKSGFVYGNECELATSIPLSKEEAEKQIGKLNDTNFYLNNFEFETNGVFVRKQELNSLRRLAIENIEKSFMVDNKINVNYDNLYIEKTANKSALKTIEFGEKSERGADFFVVKPKNYLTFNYNSVLHKDAYLYIPPFLRNEDLEVINSILNKNRHLGIYAENIGALNYNRKTILGAKLNIKNVYACRQLINDNVVLVVASPEISEKNLEILRMHISVPIINMGFENCDLMTLVHCPIKTLFGNNCLNCKYTDDIVYKMENGKCFRLQRYKIFNCYFTLQEIN